MITEVENIILNKEYFELTAEELESVSELVQNADEYDEMKWFLASTEDVLVSDKIEATPELKEKVLAHLNNDERKRKFWLNGVGVFLWPTDKDFYRRPAFQMSLAALLLLGFLMIYDRNLNPEQGMALNDPAKEVVSKNEVEEKEKVFEIVDETKIEDELSDVHLDTPDLRDSPEESDNGLVLDLESPNDLSPLEEEDADEVMTVTDMDGYYEPTVESEEIVDEDRDLKSVNNANNNEISNDFYRMTNSDDSNKDQDNRNDDAELDDLSDNQPSNKNERDKLRKESKKNKDDQVAMTTTDVMEDYDMSYGNSNTGGGFADSTSFAYQSQTTNTGTSGTSEDPGSPDNDNSNSTTIVNAEINQSIDGDLSLDNANDIIPSQMSVKNTPELKSLFKTFK